MSNNIQEYAAQHFPDGTLRIERQRDRKWRAYWRKQTDAGRETIGGYPATTPMAALITLAIQAEQNDTK